MIKIDRWLVLAVILAVAASLIFPTSYDQSLGRWGGAIWELVRRMPDVAGRSIVFPPLAALGAVVLVHAWRAACRAGRARETAVLMLSILGWTIAQSFNTQAGQRYVEPIILVALAWLSACAASPRENSGATQPPVSFRWNGVILLGLIQLGLSLWSVYWPVLSWQPTTGP